MKTISPHRKSGRHSKGSRDKTLTDRHYESLVKKTVELEKELRVAKK